jgi:hypothetical protein
MDLQQRIEKLRTIINQGLDEVRQTEILPKYEGRLTIHIREDAYEIVLTSNVFTENGTESWYGEDLGVLVDEVEEFLQDVVVPRNEESVDFLLDTLL